MAGNLRWSEELQTIPSLLVVCIDILLDRLRRHIVMAVERGSQRQPVRQ